MSDRDPAKRCSRCHEVKPLTDFYRASRASDGRCAACKACEVERKRIGRVKYPETQKRAIERWRERNREKRAAHMQLAHAVEHGRIIKPEACSRCDSRGLIHAHHEDYSQPLDVMWLCPKCHKARHRERELSDA